MPAHVNNRGRRKVTTVGSWHIYDYVSPSVTLPHEKLNNEALESLSGGVTITQLSKADMETYFKDRQIGRLSRTKNN